MTNKAAKHMEMLKITEHPISGKVLINTISDDFFADTQWSFHSQKANEANAAYIVKACNAYPKLIEALRTLSNELRIHDNDLGDGVFIRERDLKEYTELLSQLDKEVE